MIDNKIQGWRKQVPHPLCFLRGVVNWLFEIALNTLQITPDPQFFPIGIIVRLVALGFLYIKEFIIRRSRRGRSGKVLSIQCCLPPTLRSTGLKITKSEEHIEIFTVSNGQVLWLKLYVNTVVVSTIDKANNGRLVTYRHIGVKAIQVVYQMAETSNRG